MPTQALQAAAQVTQVAQTSGGSHLLTLAAIVVSCCSLIVSMTSVYVALKNNWISSRETGKKALAQFYEYSRQAYDLALANFYDQEFNNQKYFHLLGADIFVELEKAGRTQEVKEAIDDLDKHFNMLLGASTNKENKTKPEDLLKTLFYIRQKSIWLIEEYRFAVYFWNIFKQFK